MESNGDIEWCQDCGNNPVTTEVLDDSRLCDECAEQWAKDNGYTVGEKNG